MTGEERQQKIVVYGQAYSQLTQALQRYPAEMWQFKPAPDRWSIHEIVIHIADSEVNSYIRCRRFIAEPGKTVMNYDENRWATLLRYHQQSPAEALELFKWLRLATHNLIQTLPESTWSNTVYHPEIGTITLDDWLEIYARHIPEHIEQMESNYQLWLKNKTQPE